MELSDLTGKHKNAALNIGLIIVAFLIAQNIYKNDSRQVDELKNKGVLEQQKNDELDKISKLEKKIDYFKGLFSEKDSGLVMSAIAGIARESGVKIVSMRPTVQGQDLSEYLKYYFDLTISADDYHAIGRFVSRLESFKDIYFVDDAQIASRNQENGYSVTLKVSYIVYKK